MTYYIGIDPGITGAISVINKNGDIYAVQDLPVMQYTEKKKEIDCKKLFDILDSLSLTQTKFVYLEQVHAMPGNGSVSMFSFGMTYGAIRSVIQTCGYTTVSVAPQSWKAHFQLLRQEKSAVGGLVTHLYGNDDNRFITVRGRVIDGRCDATLIARYAYETENL